MGSSTIKTAGQIAHPDDLMQNTSVVYSGCHQKTTQDTVADENIDPDNNCTKRLECLKTLRSVLLHGRVLLHGEHYPRVLALDPRASLSTATPPVVTRPPQSAGDASMQQGTMIRTTGLKMAHTKTTRMKTWTALVAPRKIEAGGEQ